MQSLTTSCSLSLQSVQIYTLKAFFYTQTVSYNKLLKLKEDEQLGRPKSEFR